QLHRGQGVDVHHDADGPAKCAFAAEIGAKPLFFFSSRRRHTRSTRDWSSDVCSSDLEANYRVSAVYQPARDSWLLPPSEELELRSEERRVGKHWRSLLGGGEFTDK